VVTARPSCFQRVGRYRVTSDESGQSGTESAHGQESGDRRNDQNRSQEGRQIPDRQERQRRDCAAEGEEVGQHAVQITAGVRAGNMPAAITGYAS
jgi:hypothetical protein